MRRKFENYYQEVVERLRELRKIIAEWEKDYDPSFYYRDQISDIYESVRRLETALTFAKFERQRGRYSKAIDILEDALENSVIP